ncbi:3-phosphoglycerate dehydrogenase [Aestuariivirga litoralis]|uniref:3-phosphoglycerate dehydrogenase n=1 Tax=Aestuariivirga litoralis TaxID=2650924 RepID=A0A2W2BEQ8_9HYPH|nr:hydroxyacid dehydrogenase [Aestuariivirga litoralis]PZF78754.1 3-phosphoglycerate dehydrogenase [Aestuariivirga litoralis]
MAHILVAGKLHAAGLERLKAAKDMSFTLVDEISLESYLPHVGTADAVILRTQPMTAEVVAAAPNLKIVSRHGVGYDAVDVKALSARGIPLAIVGDVNSRAVAEHTLMLMLATARKAAQHDAAIRRGQWNVRNRFETVELDGKTLLLVGFGRIGRRVAQLANAFGMAVAAYDPFVKPEVMAKHGVRPEPDLVKALGSADYVSLHMPGTTAGAVMWEEEIGAMKPGAILVNAARGGLVDEAALDRALREGRLAGAGLDVFKTEPPPADDPLLANERVLLSPHAAGLTAECAARMAVASVQNVLDHFAGRLDPALVVNAAELAQAPGRA